MTTEAKQSAPAGADADGQRLIGPQVALVLGAGGARGLAHIGVLEVMAERGYQVGAIVGSSMGALVGGIFAAGHLQAYRDWSLALDRGNVIKLVDFVFGHPGLIKGERVIGALRELVGEHRIEDLPVPYTAVATDLGSQRQVWLDRGKLFDAIRASIAIPMLLTPHRIHGRDLVDGGLLAPIPIAATRRSFAELVIAVDVNARPRHAARERPVTEEDHEPAPAAPPGMGARVAGFLGGLVDWRAKPDDSEPPGPGLVTQMSRSLDAMQGQLSRMQLAADPPDILIKVPRDSCEFHEFWRTEHMVAIGREAATRAFDAWERR